MKKYTLTIATLSVALSVTTLASLSGLPIESSLDTYLNMAIRIARFIVGFGIIFTAISFFKGSQMWMLGLGIIMVALIIGNLNTILDLLGMTGGVLM